MKDWERKIFSINSKNAFNALALEAFNYQYNNISVYRDYCNLLNVNVESVSQYSQIPFIPIEFFKTHNILCENCTSEITFSSSGTTGTVTSKHNIVDLKLYESSFLKSFTYFFGNVKDYCILALLPSYIERGGSSLVYMADKLISLSKHDDSGFYLNNYSELANKLQQLNKKKTKTILLGVTYALLDLAEQFPQDLSNIIIMETGGMKGRRKELIREDLHNFLYNSFNVNKIYSEYGMTELLSQAYSKGEGIFETPPWMKILIRDTYDPFCYVGKSRSGGINVIDLANIYSCCFIETKDIGKVFENNKFTVLGRFDNSDIRGCNLMIE